MKKILVLFMFVSSILSCSHSLENLNKAIIQSDKELVIHLVNSLEITDSELMRFCNLADQTIEKRRDFVGYYFRGRLGPTDNYKFDTKEKSIIISSVISSFLLGIYKIGKTYFTNLKYSDSTWDCQHFLKTEHRDTYMLSIFFCACVAIIGLSIAEQLRQHRYGKLMQHLYDNAIEIKTHIWQHFNHQKELFQKRK